MIHDQHGFSVSIRNGLNGAIAPEYDSENSRTSRSIEAAADATLCPQITIHKNFNWHGADGLYVAIRYGSRPYQLKVWVPKPAMSILNEEDNCSFQIPGKNIWDPATKKPIGCEYRIADLDIWKCDKIFADCPDLKQKNEDYLGRIWVSVRRRKIKDGLTPTSEAEHTPGPPQKMCQHSAAVRTNGVKHTVKKVQVESFESFHKGSMICDPTSDAFIGIEGNQGNWMNTVFVFRPREQLQRIIDGQVKLDPENTEIANAEHLGQRSTTPKTLTTTATPPPISVSGMSNKRRASQAEQLTVAEADSSSNNATTDRQPKKPKKHRRAAVGNSKDIGLGLVGLSSPAAISPKAPTHAKQSENKTESIDEDLEREVLLQAFTSRTNTPETTNKPKRARPTAPRPKLSDHVLRSGSAGRSSTSDLGAQLTEEYQNLREAGKSNRRSASKNTPASAMIEEESTALRPTIPGTRSTSKEQSASSRQSNDSPPTQTAAPETATQSEEPDPAPATPEKRIKALRAQEKKELLQKQLEQKLQAECEELERQLLE